MITIYIDDDKKLYYKNLTKIYLPDELQNSSLANVLKENDTSFELPKDKCFFNSTIYNDKDCINMINTYHYFGLDFPYNEVLLYLRDGKNIQIYTIISQSFYGTKRLFTHYSSCYFEVRIVELNIELLRQLDLVFYPKNILLLAKSCSKTLDFLLKKYNKTTDYDTIRIIYQHAVEYSNIELVNNLLKDITYTKVPNVKYNNIFKIKIHTLEMLEFLDKYLDINFNCLSWYLPSPFFAQMVIYLINSGKKLNKQQEDIIAVRYNIQYDHVTNTAQYI